MISMGATLAGRDPYVSTTGAFCPAVARRYVSAIVPYGHGSEV